MNCVGTSCLNEVNFETYTNILEILKEESSCAVVQPTGTGKSYIMMELLKTFKDSWKIVIAPSRDFLNNLEHNKYWVSEKTLTLTYSFIGINCDNIVDILAEYKINPEQVGLIIVDEMHRAGAPKWGAGVKNLMAICKNAKTVGLTATPKRLDEDRDMVEELFGGRTARNMNLAEAVQLGIVPLLNYTVGMHDINTNISEIRDSISDDSSMKYLLNMLDEYKNKWDFTNYFTYTLGKYINTDIVEGKHIIFASSIEEAEQMAKVVKPWFQKLYNTKNVKVYCIHSKEAKKSVYMEEFFSPNSIGEVKVAVAVNMLNESFHCKDIKTISMFRGTQSLNVYMQQIGRAISSDGEVPYIFDFVDNYHTIDSLHEMLTLDNMMELGEIYDTKSFVFNEFNDETTNFVVEMHRIKRLINRDITEVTKEIKTRLNESDDGTIFSVRDELFIDWASQVLKDIYIFRLPEADFNDLIISYDIAKSLGYSWYKQYRIYINNRENMSERELKAFRSTFNKSFLLNSANKLTIDFFKNKGLASNITNNEDKLRNLLIKSEPKLFKYKDRLLVIPELDNKDTNINRFELYKSIYKVESTMYETSHRSWAEDMIGDASAFWLWNIYKVKYEHLIKEIKQEFDSYKYLDEFIATAKKCKYGLDISVVSKVNDIIKYCDTIDKLPKSIQSMLEYHKIKSMSRIYECMCKQLHIDVDEENLLSRLKGQLKIGPIDYRLIEYAKYIKESATEHIDVNNIEWVEAIVNRYNRLIDVCDEIINLEGINIEDTKYTYEFIIKSKEDLMPTKVKKNYTEYNSKMHNKLDRTVELYKHIEEIRKNIHNDYISNFDFHYEKALKQWRDYREDDTLFVALIALSRSDACKNNIGINKIKYKLQKVIATSFDWLIESEYSKVESDDNMSKLKLAFEIIGEDIWYLCCSALSKKNRELGLLVHKQFMTTGKILSKNAISFFDEVTAGDSQILHNISECKTIENLDRFKQFYSKLVETYGNTRI